MVRPAVLDFARLVATGNRYGCDINTRHISVVFCIQQRPVLLQHSPRRYSRPRNQKHSISTDPEPLTLFKFRTTTTMPFLGKRTAPVTPTPQKTTYSSKEVPIPPRFLIDAAHDSQPVTVTRIDFANTDIPQYAGKYAVILENVLSPSECSQLLSLAEASAPTDDGKPWRPALVNVGGNYEVHADDYRKSERIIWDQQELVNRILARCTAAEDGMVGRDLATIEGNEHILGQRAAEYQKWRLTRGNERMRFLRYEPGMFFQRHCDGSYESLEDHAKQKPYERTHYTLHLYLNGDGIEGGETTFWSRSWPMKDEKRVDVAAKLGRVLIFQHRGLTHSGEEVSKGVKYTMRTDLLYERTDDVGGNW